MRIAVTGGLGRLGRYVVEALSGHEVLVVDVVAPPSPSARHRTADLRDFEALCAAFAGCEVVVHLGGIDRSMATDDAADHAGERDRHLERLRGRPARRCPPDPLCVPAVRSPGSTSRTRPCRPVICRSMRRIRCVHRTPTGSASGVVKRSPKPAPGGGWRCWCCGLASSPSRNWPTSWPDVPPPTDVPSRCRIFAPTSRRRTARLPSPPQSHCRSIADSRRSSSRRPIRLRRNRRSRGWRRCMEPASRFGIRPCTRRSRAPRRSAAGPRGSG